MKIVKRIFVHLLCFLIPDKNSRKFLRRFLLRHSALLYLKDCIKVFRFSLREIPDNTVLIVEGNMFYHSEVLPGYIKYFNDLGYKCDVLLSNHNLSIDPFYRSRHLNYKAFGFFYFSSLANIFSCHKQITKYKKIFVATTIIADDDAVVQDFVSAIGKNGELYKDKICIMVHSLFSIKEFNLQKYVDNNQLFVLSNFKTNNYPTLSPHYYGKVKKDKSKAEMVRFLSVGRIEPGVKNYELLFQAARELLNNGFTSFKVIFIGWSGNVKVDADLASHVEIRGKVDFKNLHEEIENCDFMLSLLDPKHERHFMYSYDLSSGSNLLSMAFNKPYIINSLFAETSGFDTTNAVVYEDDDLFGAMKKAVTMNQTEYNQIKIGLEDLQQKIADLSAENLKKVLN